MQYCFWAVLCIKKTFFGATFTLYACLLYHIYIQVERGLLWSDLNGWVHICMEDKAADKGVDPAPLYWARTPSVQQGVQRGGLGQKGNSIRTFGHRQIHSAAFAAGGWGATFLKLVSAGWDV